MCLNIYEIIICFRIGGFGMRIVVISDSHKNTKVIDTIISSQPDAKHIFFLGDNVADIEDFLFLYPDKTFHIVSGNCDYMSTVPCVNIEILEGVKILYTHGHTYSVKYGTQRLFYAAKENGYNIVLYGHTHTSNILYEDGIYLVNPGSCSQPRNSKASYAVIDITKSGIMPIIIEL